MIDEVSMVDVPLAWRLFQAIDRAKTAVVLVGDHNQLPPVGPGNLLRDLVKSRATPTTVLTQIWNCRDSEAIQGEGFTRRGRPLPR